MSRSARAATAEAKRLATLVDVPVELHDERLTTASADRSMLDAGLNVQSVNVTLDACIGFCVSPEHGRQPDELLRRAAVAKNDAQQGQKRIRIYQNGREARHVCLARDQTPLRAPCIRRQR